MISIPLIDLKERTGIKTKFNNFNLKAENCIIDDLEVKLSYIKIDNKSKNRLLLNLSDTVNENNEEYTLTIKENLIKIESPSLVGIGQGLSTLKILLYSGSNILEHGVIKDAPKFPNRGIFLDISRGKMPTMQYLKDLITLMSDLKYNILQLYSEDKLEMKSDPSIGKLTGAYSEEEIRELDIWCQRYFIELQPCVQTYSHLHGLLYLPEYHHLSENENLFSIAAGKEEVYEFFDKVFSNILPWFSSKTLNINMDEAYDLGTGYTKEAVVKQGKGLVYLKHIMRIYDIAKKYGAQKIIVWGDIALKYKELLDMLPDDIIIADWNYNPLKEFPSLETLKHSKAKFWAGGGVSTWNSLFPRVYNSYINLNYYSNQSYEKGAEGFLITDWGDYGHMQPLGLSLYGYMVGANQSYHAEITEVLNLENNIFPLIFKDKRIKEAFRLLMDSNLAPNLKTDFKTMSVYYFFDDLFDGLSMNGDENYPRLNRETFRVLEKNGREAYIKIKEVLDDSRGSYGNFPDPAWERLFGEDLLKELLFSARSTMYTGIKGNLSLDIKERFKSEDLSQEDILEYIVEIKQLYSEFLIIRGEFEDVWISRSRLRGIESVILTFDKASVQLGEAVKWLSKQYKNLRLGKEVDKNLETYRAADNYEILWTADYRNMWDRAYPWQ